MREKLRRNAEKRKSKGEAPVTGPKKRNLSAEQANFLEMNFGNERKLEAERKMRLATELGLDPKQVAVWFQNRRARWKSKKMEEEYTRLKRTHETLFLEKCSLEKEVLRLKDQLSEAEKEIMKLSEKAEGSRETGGGGSPSSPSFSMDVFHPAFPLGFSMEENENPFCMTETYLGPLWPSDSIIYV